MPTTQYYELIPRHVSKVSILWKCTHLAFALTVTCTSAIATASFQQVTFDLGERCFVNTKLVFLPTNRSYLAVGDYKLNVSFLTPATVWGSDDGCQLIFFTYNISLMIGFVLFSFMFLLPKGGVHPTSTMYVLSCLQAKKVVLPVAKRYSRGDLFVFPSTIVSFVILCLVLIADHTVTYNTRDFCHQLKTALHLKRCRSPKINELTLAFHKYIQDLSGHIVTLRLSSPMVLYSWFCMFGSFLIRMCAAPDFMLNVYTISNAREKSRLSSTKSLFEEDMFKKDR